MGRVDVFRNWLVLHIGAILRRNQYLDKYFDALARYFEWLGSYFRAALLPIN